MNTTRNRDEVLRECVKAATACWNHYADSPLSSASLDRLEMAFHGALPKEILTSSWQKFAEEQQKKYADEEVC